MMHSQFLRIDHHDKVDYNGTSWRGYSHGTEGVTLQNVQDPSVFDTISDDKLRRLLRAPHFKHWPGHFSQNSARFRAMATEELLIDWPVWQREKILERVFCVQRWQTEEDAGNVKRSLRHAKDFITTLNHEMMVKCVNRNLQHKKRQTGQRVEITFGPSFDTLMRWVRRYEKAGGNPLALRDGRCNSGNRNQKFCAETYAFIDEHILAYTSPQCPYANEVASDTRFAIDDENKKRAAAGKNLLGKPCVRQFERYIGEIAPFLVACGRLGVDRARNKFMCSSGGLESLVPGERFEMDGWKGDVMILLQDSGMISKLPPEILKKIPRERVWVYVVIDHATRCVVGLRVVLNGTADDTVRTLEMATRDKTAISDAVGTTYSWVEGSGFSMLVSDQGSEFANDRCETAVLAALAAYERNPAAAPSLRGVNERLFGVFSTKVTPMMSGRTFGNIFERGDVDPASTAALTPEQLLRILIWFVVDVYHRTPHPGIGYMAPSAKWAELTKEVGTTPPPDGYRMRAAFGEQIERQVEGRGVLVNGIRYTSPKLRKHFIENYKCNVDIRIDPYDISWILVRAGDEWIAAYSTILDLEGITSEEWGNAHLARKREGQAQFERDLPAIRRAIAAMKKICGDAAALVGLTPKRLTAAYINKLERELFFGEEVIPWSDPEPIPDAGGVFVGGFATGQAEPKNMPLETPVNEAGAASRPTRTRPKWTLEEDK
jgi:putative transposase